GDTIRLTAGCDKRFETCRIKFANTLNFRGFPHVPREDWLMATPRLGDANSGGSLTDG
ncbi:MAG: phage BR0599 family protein, partial [Rhodobacteraceae bacterium]|nr:phage BR0599 family protein [Paracoccaceae bacterium]